MQPLNHLRNLMVRHIITIIALFIELMRNLLINRPLSSVLKLNAPLNDYL